MTLNKLTWVRWTAAMVLISAALFAMAFTVERGGFPNAVGVAAHTEVGEGGEASEASQGPSEVATGEQLGRPEISGEVARHVDQTLVGVNLENPWIEWGFVAVSAVVAVAVLLMGQPALMVAGLVAGSAAILDFREVVAQAGRADLPVGILAMVVALTHDAVVGLAILAWRSSRDIGSR